MKSVQPLIDKASEMCGGDSALAERMGIPRQNVYLMRTGKRPISPATAAELADIAGDDARQAAIDAIIESAKGTRREGVLREILGKALAAGVAAMCLFFYSADSTYAMERVATSNSAFTNVYIVSSNVAFAVVIAAGYSWSSPTSCRQAWRHTPRPSAHAVNRRSIDQRGPEVNHQYLEGKHL